MKVFQRLEVFLGFVYFVSTLAYLYFISIPSSKGIAELYNDSSQVLHWSSPSVIIGITLHLTIPICSYLHAFKRSYVALGIIVVWGGLFFFLTVYGVILGTAFEGHPWIGISPAIAAFLTIVLAFINTIIFLQNRNEKRRLNSL